jgi:hypothetical protein
MAAILSLPWGRWANRRGGSRVAPKARRESFTDAVYRINFTLKFFAGSTDLGSWRQFCHEHYRRGPADVLDCRAFQS